MTLPDSVSYTDAAGLLGDGVKAYTALYYLGRACAGDTVLIVDAASSWASLAVQLAQSWGTKVIHTVLFLNFRQTNSTKNVYFHGNCILTYHSPSQDVATDASYKMIL